MKRTTRSRWRRVLRRLVQLGAALVILAFLALVVAYALSPIDLIPDFIPVLGYLDDVLLLPLGIYLALKLIPAAVLADARHAAHQASFNLSASRAAAVVIILLWMISMTVGGVFVLRYFDAI